MTENPTPPVPDERGRPTVLLAVQPDLAARFFEKTVLARLAATCELIVSPDPRAHLSDEVRPLLARSDAMITGWRTARVDEAVLDAAPRLRAIVHSAGSVREFVAAAAYDRDIVISSQAWVNAVPVAEYTLAMILLAGKGVMGAEQTYRARRSPLDPIEHLAERGNYGTTVGIIGASFVGRRVLDLLKPFDLEVLLYDPFVTDAEAESFGADRVGLEALMARSSVVSLHAPLLPATRGMIDRRLLQLMPDGATFINTARGAIVVEDDLVAELGTGRIRAVLDVTDPETPHADHPFWSMPQVTLTPHIAGAFGNELHRLGAAVADEIGRLANGQPLKHAVPREAFAVRA